ncbi:hypothetical protein [Flavobacterium sp. CS20]|jgi:hypothetical protein|uniref:hypothetical protein n=1 Tax=Flavobacterium sp. CS20 TaxID=2775246 RepID=UPI001B3A7AA8|nr:hypothetical protein [Flavobacterium sp. CS20]QTY27766.1 hypothetical protein IGB25_04380 [Flavobacterium sp. CS20]
MKTKLIYIFIVFVANFGLAQEFSLPPLSPDELSPQIQSPLYQDFDVNEFDLLVKNVNVFASPNTENAFDFMQASVSKTHQLSYQNFYDAIDRQMSQYANFKVEIDNSKSSIFMDYNNQPIYSGSFRVKNSVYQRADKLTGTPRRSPLLYSPSLSSRRGLIWY